MNHIHRLTKERDRAQARAAKMEADLIDLQAYLSCDKFRWPDNDWVSAREMWRRVQDIRVESWRD